MDRQTRIDLTMMVLELRVASRSPSELVGRCLPAKRLQEIAAVLEHVIEEGGQAVEFAKGEPANDRTTSSPPVPARRSV